MKKIAMFTIHPDKDFKKKLSMEDIRQWIGMNEKNGRFFWDNRSKCLCRPATAPMPKFHPWTEEFLYVAGDLLSDENSRFYFDIEKHRSGVEVIKLDLSQKYNCNVIAKETDGGPLPQHGIFSAEETSQIISMLAYKMCFDNAKREGNTDAMNEYKVRYEKLFESQAVKPFLGQFVFFFGNCLT